MGRVTAVATIENVEDMWAAKRGLMAANEVRMAEVPDALVDTGATLLSLPTRLINELGLEFVSSRRVVSSTGITEAGIYSAVRLTMRK